MTNEKALTVQPQGVYDLILPPRGKVEQRFAAIAEFQALAQRYLRKNLDYGVIPGTSRPTLLKPGAEKIAKLLELADTYEVTSRIEDWEKGFFNYEVRCSLRLIGTGSLVAQGIGSCNSMEARYRWRWVAERDLPPSANKLELVKTIRTSGKTGGRWTVYRLPNDDIFSQVNTLLKMAKKRALVDAALSAGRLSDIFTQDLDDMEDPRATVEGVVQTESEPPPSGGAKPSSQGSAVVEGMVTPGWSAPESPVEVDEGASTPRLPPAEKGRALPGDNAQPLLIVTAAQLASLRRIAAAKGLSEEALLQVAANQGIAHVAEVIRLTYEQASKLISALQRRERT